jgi:hypothetical protein
LNPSSFIRFEAWEEPWTSDVHSSYNDSEDKGKLAKIELDLKVFGRRQHLGKTFRTLYLSARERGLVRGICDKLNDQGGGLERGGAQGSDLDVFLGHYVRPNHSFSDGLELIVHSTSRCAPTLTRVCYQLSSLCRCRYSAVGCQAGVLPFPLKECLTLVEQVSARFYLPTDLAFNLSFSLHAHVRA